MTMKEKLIELLGLDAKASEERILQAVAALQSKAAAETDAAKADKAIRALVAESGNALSYDDAKKVLADRAAHAQRTAPAAKK